MARWSATIVVIAIFVAVVKPWGGTGGGRRRPCSRPPRQLIRRPRTPWSNRPRRRPASTCAIGRSCSGARSRCRGWGLWPAGYLVTFGFAAPVPPVGLARPEPRPPRPSRPTRSSPPSSSPAGSAQSSAPPFLSGPSGSTCPRAAICSCSGSTRRSATTSARSSCCGTGRDGTLEPVEIELLPSPWPDHFTRHRDPQPGDRRQPRGLAARPLPPRLDDRSGSDSASRSRSGSCPCRSTSPAP